MIFIHCINEFCNLDFKSWSGNFLVLCINILKIVANGALTMTKHFLLIVSTHMKSFNRTRSTSKLTAPYPLFGLGWKTAGQCQSEYGAPSPKVKRFCSDMPMGRINSITNTILSITIVAERTSYGMRRSRFWNRERAKMHIFPLCHSSSTITPDSVSKLSAPSVSATSPFSPASCQACSQFLDRYCRGKIFESESKTAKLIISRYFFRWQKLIRSG